MSSKSLTDIAFERLTKKKKEIPFQKLWQEVSVEANFPEAVAKRKVASFYNALMMDSRFISLESNTWDLRERHSLESLQIDPDLLDSYDDYDEDYDDYEEEVATDDE
ncbi:DNA-directed RNA polymerase subunit delta [Erysipelothrix inopinata]|uniref:RNAP delta factor n=1 Tax=Erysipelothrix inopinata TaxID=225084 RepID=A0A7G9S082_9FIRM|nr:DNA-directed RNA polymerase subunit delta [Erysipelothrix inopinata]QNN61257.1 DNA-directed RNA polymerase subunit delta [Erysipelothrix inopinata]